MAATLERVIKLKFSTSAAGVRMESDRDQFTFDDV